MASEHQQRKLWKNPVACDEAQKAIGESHLWRFAAVNRRSAQKIRCLPFIEEHIADSKFEPFECFRKPMHFHHVAGIDPILEDVRDTEIWLHVRPGVPVGVTLTTQLDDARFADATTFPAGGIVINIGDQVQQDSCHQHIESSNDQNLWMSLGEGA
ncbi:hypothetical protein ASJ79_01610 [Mycobacterium sp. NAZ190054]|nr:hypothetical protein ASJ79_01610 [Mycobacterium sp. NAZ190054]